MAQAHYCRVCNVAFGAELRGKSCPACGEELIHGRIPASKTIRRAATPAKTGRAVWDYIIKRDVCAYCAVNEPASHTTIDHIVPKALGGSKGSWTNRAGSCRPCNARKAHTPLLFFLLEERGVDLRWMKDEDGHWPIPEERAREEVVPAPEPDEPQRLLATLHLSSEQARRSVSRPVPNKDRVQEMADRYAALCEASGKEVINVS